MTATILQGVQCCHHRSIVVGKRTEPILLRSLLAWFFTWNNQTYGRWASAGTLLWPDCVWGGAVSEWTKEAGAQTHDVFSARVQAAGRTRNSNPRVQWGVETRRVRHVPCSCGWWRWLFPRVVVGRQTSRVQTNPGVNPTNCSTASGKPNRTRNCSYSQDGQGSEEPMYRKCGSSISPSSMKPWAGRVPGSPARQKRPWAPSPLPPLLQPGRHLLTSEKALPRWKGFSDSPMDLEKLACYKLPQILSGKRQTE